MKKTITVSAKSMEEAKLLAAEQFSVAPELLSGVVVTEPKKGFLGIGSTLGEFSFEYGKDNADLLEGWIAAHLLEFCDEREIAAYADDVSFVVLYQAATEETIRERLETLVARLNQENGILTEDYKITIRAGGYHLRRQKDSASRVCNIANEAYHRAEELEANCFFADAAFIKLVERREQLQRETVQAVKKNQILYYMQYVVDLKKNCIYGAEALSRWEHPREGLLTPGVYIGLMQHAKVIGVLDYYMFERSCQQLERWERDGLTDFCVSCNFDRLTVGASDFYDRILEIASKYQFNRNHMILEITEDTADTAWIRNVVIENLYAETTGYLRLEALHEGAVENVVLRNWNLVLKDGELPFSQRCETMMGESWFFAKNLKGLVLENLRITDEVGRLNLWKKPFCFENCTEGEISRVSLNDIPVEHFPEEGE